MSRRIIQTGNTFVRALDRRANMLGYSNDFSNGGSGTSTADGRWSHQTGFTSATKTATDPFGVVNNAQVLTVNNSGALVLRQNVLSNRISVGEYLSLSLWIKKVAGGDANARLRFDVGDGTPSPIARTTDNDTWYFFHFLIQAGSNDWLDIFTANVTGANTFHVYGLSLVHGSRSLPYLETTTTPIYEEIQTQSLVKLDNISTAIPKPI